MSGVDESSILTNDEIIRLQGYPNLRDYTITSERTDEYNCFAWALGCTSRWVEPNPDFWLEQHPGYYWPEGLSTELTVSTLIDLFRIESYEVCADGEVEAGFEKIAIYAFDDDDPTHAARQLENGRWTSKLGNWEDIEHATPEELSSGLDSQRGYGSVVQFMKRLRVA